MAVGTAIAFAAFHLESDNFLGFQDFENFAHDFGTGDHGGTDVEFAVFGFDSEDLIKNHFCAVFHGQLLHFNNVAGFDLELLAAALNNSVHF